MRRQKSRRSDENMVTFRATTEISVLPHGGLVDLELMKIGVLA